MKLLIQLILILVCSTAFAAESELIRAGTPEYEQFISIVRENNQAVKRIKEQMKTPWEHKSGTILQYLIPRYTWTIKA